jgi:hypothetical protein
MHDTTLSLAPTTCHLRDTTIYPVRPHLLIRPAMLESRLDAFK